jgi:hypothetical protein
MYFIQTEEELARIYSVFDLLKGGAGALFFVTTSNMGGRFVNVVTMNGRRGKEKTKYLIMITKVVTELCEHF